MTTQEHPSQAILNPDKLHEAPLADLLLYGLTLDDAEPGLGVLRAARRELGVVVTLAERGQPGAQGDVAELFPVLESISRRLDVAIELLTRAPRTATRRAGATAEETSAS